MYLLVCAGLDRLASNPRLHDGGLRSGDPESGEKPKDVFGLEAEEIKGCFFHFRDKTR